MIRAVVVDGEKSALDELCRLLAGQPGVKVLGSYLSIKKALEDIASLQPDVVFLDIDLPGFSGRELAEAVGVISNESSVVYVTAYSEYALDAFGVEAIDYLVKPVSKERLIQALDRLEKKRCQETKPLIRRILTLGPLELIDAEGKVLDIKWRTIKTRELFALLVHHRESTLKKDSIIEWLWPELEREKGSRVFHTTVHYLRKVLQTIGLPDTLRFSNSRYVLNLGEIECDAEEFECLSAKKVDGDSGRLELMKRAINIYRGSYFEDKDYGWAVDKRNSLRLLYLDLLQQVAEELVSYQAYDEAQSYLEKLVRQNPLNEEAQCLLMETYAEKGDRDRLVRQFEDYKRALKEESGAEPEREVRLHFYHLLKKCLE